MKEKPIVAITMGDPAGNGPEITVKALADWPGKRWEGLVEKALWAVVAAIIAFLLARIGL